MPTLVKPGLIAVVTLFGIAPAFADPIGDWRVADGTAIVRVHKCGSSLCGSVLSTTGDPGKDSHNPDPSKRQRSVIGLEVLINMTKATENSWTGATYNAEDGQTYSARITLLSDQQLQIQGCVPGGGACGSETWARVK
jgi:uncharacterized protein (DUF2147 family)